MKKFFSILCAVLFALSAGAFTMDTVPSSTNVISIAFDSTTNLISITTTNEDPYIFVFESQIYYDEFQSDLSQSSLADEAKEYYDFYSKYGYDDLIRSGNQSIDVTTYFETNLESGDFIVITAPYDSVNGVVNGTCSYLQFHYVEPLVVITDTVSVHFVSPYWKNQVADQGWWQVMAANGTDTTYFVSLSPASTSAVAGTYTLTDMDDEYTYIMDANTSTTSVIPFQELSVTVSEDAAGVVTISAEGDARNGVHYIMTFDSIDPAATALRLHAVEQKAVKVIRDGQLIIETNGMKYNAQGAKL